MNDNIGYLKSLIDENKEDLINDIYNRRVSEFADYKDDQDDPHGRGKRLPYIGWFWRDTDFVGKRIAIGNCGEFIGVMENNKWDYPERLMTESEANTFINHLERLFAAGFKGGGKKEMDEARSNEEKICQEIWDWFQTLQIR